MAVVPIDLYNSHINIQAIMTSIAMDEVTTVQILKTTRDRLLEIGKKKESYDTIINRAVDALEKHEGSSKKK